MSTARAMTGDEGHQVPQFRRGADEMVVRAPLRSRRRQGALRFAAGPTTWDGPLGPLLTPAQRAKHGRHQSTP
jgi:hypothetical protein